MLGDEAAEEAVDQCVDGREVLVPSAKIAYVEVGLADSERRMGFGS